MILKLNPSPFDKYNVLDNIYITDIHFSLKLNNK